MRKAVVVGGTGAVGEHVVGALLMSGSFTNVVTVGRRPVKVPDQYPSDQFKGELSQVTVDMDKLAEAGDAFKGADSVFCCLGTTRKVAGSAEGFRKVDLGYVAASAQAAKAAGASHFSLVSSVGANANAWASDWLICAPLLYIKVKGLAEEAVKAQGFASTAIYRPGLLDRGDKVRGVEKAMAALTSGLPCNKLAALMVKHAAAAERPALKTYEASDIKKGVASL